MAFHAATPPLRKLGARPPRRVTDHVPLRDEGRLERTSKGVRHVFSVLCGIQAANVRLHV
eukprot:COSAG02_NODE_269_length_26468_cov_4.489021_23_plen_60_part_00